MRLFKNGDGKIELRGKNQALLILNDADLYYFTGYSNADAAVVLTEKGKYYVCDKRVAEEAKELLSDYHIIDVGKQGYLEVAKAFLIDNDIRSVGIEQSSIKHLDYKELVRGGAFRLVNADSEISKLRAVKSECELDLIRRAQAITDEVFTEVLEFVKEGITERELSAFIDGRIHLKGGSCAFDTIAAFGANTSKPHAHPSDRTLKEGDPVTIDFGARYLGYCSDMTRSFCFGYASDEYVKVYNAVLSAQQAALDNIKAGMTGAECHDIAVKYLEELSLSEYFTHSLGHSLGVEIHETPNLSPRYSGEIPVGAVTSVEPGVYLPSKFGVRIEDIVVFRKYGVENLTNSLKNLIIVK